MDYLLSCCSLYIYSVLIRPWLNCTVLVGNVGSSWKGSLTSVLSPVHSTRYVPSVSKLHGVAGVPLLGILAREYVCREAETIPQGSDLVWRMTSNKAKDTDQVSAERYISIGWLHGLIMIVQQSCERFRYSYIMWSVWHVIYGMMYSIVIRNVPELSVKPVYLPSSLKNGTLTALCVLYRDSKHWEQENI